jgi:hypothetical protein
LLFLVLIVLTELHNNLIFYSIILIYQSKISTTIKILKIYIYNNVFYNQSIFLFVLFKVIYLELEEQQRDETKKIDNKVKWMKLQIYCPK